MSLSRECTEGKGRPAGLSRPLPISPERPTRRHSACELTAAFRPGGQGAELSQKGKKNTEEECGSIRAVPRASRVCWTGETLPEPSAGRAPCRTPSQAAPTSPNALGWARADLGSRPFSFSLFFFFLLALENLFLPENRRQ